MESALALLQKENMLISSFDRHILPGESIPKKIEEKISASDIIVFLLSQNFISSGPCMDEWKKACQMLKDKPQLKLIPIILGDCAWKDIENMANLKALPEDAKPINQFDDEGTAWHQVYEGIKDLIKKLQESFTPKENFLKEMGKTGFISHESKSLIDIFVFPRLHHDDDVECSNEISEQGLLKSKHVLIHGDRVSGKTALCKYLFLILVGKETPVLYVDMEAIGKKVTPDIFCAAYEDQFSGDYSLWEKQSDKVIIFDNLSETEKSIQCLLLAKKHFEKILVTVSSHKFDAYFADEEQLAEFDRIKIFPFTYVKQGELIKNRVKLFDPDQSINHEHQIDVAERQVNSVVIQQKILPRYPFYILSILQTLESFMPNDLTVTSFGYCYQVLIISYIAKVGIGKTDDKIDMCFNFLEYLAFKIYQGRHNARGDEDMKEEFERLVTDYKERFLFGISNAVCKRLQHEYYGLITPEGKFKDHYVYYFFLGKYLSRHSEEEECKAIIDRILERSHARSNSLILLFIIHHGNDKIVEDIVIRSMCTLDDISPATLNKKETEEIDKLIRAVPDILSSDTVEAERVKARKRKDEEEENYPTEMEDESDDAEAIINDIYRILKSNELLGQVLRNRHGSIERPRLVEIIEAIIEGGLRLINLSLLDRESINQLAAFLHKKNPELNLDEIKNGLRFHSFIWVVKQIQRIVQKLNTKEIKPLIKKIVNEKKEVPAYQLIGYFFQLDTIEELSDKNCGELEEVLSKHRYPFMKNVVSLRTQSYLNTHRIKTPLAQKICALLDIKYRPRLGASKN